MGIGSSCPAQTQTHKPGSSPLLLSPSHNTNATKIRHKAPPLQNTAYLLALQTARVPTHVHLGNTRSARMLSAPSSSSGIHGEVGTPHTRTASAAASRLPPNAGAGGHLATPTCDSDLPGLLPELAGGPGGALSRDPSHMHVA